MHIEAAGGSDVMCVSSWRSSGDNYVRSGSEFVVLPHMDTPGVARQKMISIRDCSFIDYRAITLTSSLVAISLGPGSYQPQTPWWFVTGFTPATSD
jgi:hypothetical protein